ncbi:glycosyltransferase family 4 protein [Cohnella faecalis]|uniref:glycosyltransferase family 4 protein n=1 Tax=Cohnella faecalis TaxID=2315694 RepID=UPI00361A9DB2
MMSSRIRKIAVIAYELPSPKERTGGVSHFNHRFCNMLSERGYDVTAFTVRPEVPGAEYRVKVIPGERAGGRLNRYYKAPLQARGLELGEYDLVVSSGDDWAMRRGRSPWIRIMHGSAWRELQHNKRPLRKANLALLYLLELLSSLRADVTLFNSRDTRKLYPRRKKDRIVHLPVDTRVFYPIDSSEKMADPPTLLFVGGLDSRKRGGWLLELFVTRIRPALPNARLWMVCDPGKPCEGVEYFQHASIEQLAELYRRANVFCMPSTYEGFGIPYLEAMASGTLVVTTPNPGAEELLEDGRYGWIVSDEELADALIRALERPESHAKWTEPALEWARSHDWSVMLQQFLNEEPVIKNADSFAAKGG